MPFQLPLLSGPVPAVPTMFRADAVDRVQQRRLCERIVSAGLPTLIIGGLEGEGPVLSATELVDVTAIAIGAGAIVGASICSPATVTACELASSAAAAGAAFLVVSPPPYNRPTPEGVYAHLARIAEACRSPIVLRHDPVRTRSILSEDLITRLCRAGIVSAVVLPPGDMRLSRRLDILSQGEMQSLAGSDFDGIFQQCDDRAAWLSAAAVIDPVRCRGLHEARLRGEWRTACRLSRELCPLMRALEMDEPAVTMKAALALLGIGTADLRLPLVAASEEAQRTIAHAMQLLGLAPPVPEPRHACSAS